MSRPRSGPTMAHLVLAARLTRLRELAGCSFADAARALGKHPMTVRRIEAAETSLDPDQVEALLHLYRAPADQTEEILTAITTANRRGWWHPYRSALTAEQQRWIAVESEASMVRLWSGALIPDLLQTPDYAEALHRARRPNGGGRARQAAVELVLRRQQELRRRRARVWAVISAAALHTTVGSPAVMADQYRALEEAAAQPRCTVQVVPLTAGPHPLTTAPPLRLLRISSPEIRDHAVQELPAGAVVTDDPAPVESLRHAMDVAAYLASPAGTPLAIPNDPFRKDNA